MTANKKRKYLNDLEKNDLLSKAMQILTCGDDEIVNAFSARVKTILKAVRSEKKKRHLKNSGRHPDSRENIRSSFSLAPKE
jgi:hypothetical protein